MPKEIKCRYCGTVKKVRVDAETCGSASCRMKKLRMLKKVKKS